MVSEDRSSLSYSDTRYIIVKDLGLIVAFTLAMIVIGYNTGLVLPYYMVAFMLIYVLMGYLSVSNLKLSVWLDKRAHKFHRYQNTVLKLRFYKRGLMPVIVKLSSKWALSEPVTFMLIPSDEMEVELKVIPIKIGRYDKLPMRAVLMAPFGIIYRELVLVVDADVAVYPAQLRHSAISQVIVKPFKALSYMGARRGDEFVGIREYRDGDPVADISWKHTAKYRKLMVSRWARPIGKILIIPDIRADNFLEMNSKGERPLDLIFDATFSICNRLAQLEIPFELVVHSSDTELRSVGTLERVKEVILDIGSGEKKVMPNFTGLSIGPEDVPVFITYENYAEKERFTEILGKLATNPNLRIVRLSGDFEDLEIELE